jgi:hypothetical protein
MSPFAIVECLAGVVKVQAAMKNDEGEIVDLYIPRKW